MSIRIRLIFAAVGLGVCLAAPVRAQAVDDAQPTLPIPTPEKLRIRFDLLGASYWDYSQSQLGHEAQGRIGWLIIGLSGTLTEHVSFAAEINPVDDSARPQPACGERDFFYPNVPDAVGPAIACVPDGRNRVDLYRFIGLDPLSQQGAVRQAVIDLHTLQRGVGLQGGRFMLPLGFAWHELGSWTNVDAPLIQRLNADASFGMQLYGHLRRSGRPLARVELALTRGDGNRNVEYSYQAFVDSAEDTNSGATLAGRLTLTPVPGLDVRLSGKYGYSGSKVERYPSFYLSKRNDKAVIVSGQYRPNPYVRAFGEYARYVSGLPESSATLLGLTPADVIKPGYYAGAEGSVPLRQAWEGHASVTHEDLSRNDSLVWYMSELGQYRVNLGAHLRSTIVRLSVTGARGLEIGGFWNQLENPFPWLSGIVAVSGDSAYLPKVQGSRKAGILFRLRVPAP